MPFSEELAEADLTVGALLRASTLSTLEARALLAHQLGVSREQLVARPELLVAPDDAQQFAQWVERRQRGEPLAYLLGEKEFYGRMFAVSAAVLIPRPETELLVEAALALGLRDDAHVLDLGTGSGCIGITLALERPRWQIVATDQSSHALVVARQNKEKLRANNVEFRAGNWFAAAPERFDLIVSNPPYVAAGDAHLDALRYEPLPALVSEANGLGCLYTIIEDAASHLVAGGFLALEHGHDQATAIRDRLVTAGWLEVQTLQDMASIDRVTMARSGVV